MREKFIELVSTYSNNLSITEKLWLEIEECYTEKHRAYHTLQHLQNLLNELEPVYSLIRSREAVLFALFYHDVIYKASAKDNEFRSAELAERRLSEISAPDEVIRKCSDLILATKDHEAHNDNDINIFTDADLSILGQPWKIYEEYIRQIRKEFSLYPDFLFNPGRKSALSHFIEMKRIYKTEWFHIKYEDQARNNIRKEIFMLS